MSKTKASSLKGITMTKIKELDRSSMSEVQEIFKSVFMGEPWNDDWSDEKQLHAYLKDITGNPNSLSLGLFEDDRMLGFALGNIKHWYAGTEYCIDEFCIRREKQGQGFGTLFLKEIEAYSKKKEIKLIYLQTDRNLPSYGFYEKNGYFDLKAQAAFVKTI